MLNRFLLCNKIIKAMALAAVAGTFIIGLEEAIGLAAIIFTAFGLSIGGSLIFRDTGFTVKSEEEIKQPPQAKDESKNTDTIYTPNLKNNSPYINYTIGLGLVKIFFFRKNKRKILNLLALYLKKNHLQIISLHFYHSLFKIISQILYLILSIRMKCLQIPFLKKNWCKKKIPKRWRDGDDKVDLGKFNKRKRGKKGKEEKKGWYIEKDETEHKGRECWKLKDENGTRIATLDKNGTILGK